MAKETMRLNKFIALHQGLSRRAADELVGKGRVTVDGVAARPGQQVANGQKVVVNGQPVIAKTELVYIALNKPVGYVCSRREQDDSPTVYSLLPAKLHHLKPVGRLDKDSSGLLLLTNDGDFAHSMTHPSFHKQKSYEARLNKALEPLHRQMIQDYGISLSDGKSQLQLERTEENNGKCWRVLMHEGRNRQIRRTFEALGYHVTKLHRTHFSHYTLETLGLMPGKWQEITAE